MDLISLDYFLFLLISLFIYYIFRNQQKYVLLAASLFFYLNASKAWGWKILILIMIILCDTYFGALIIEKIKKRNIRTAVTACCVAIILIPLFTLKYLPNLYPPVTDFFPNLFLPVIGLSYYSLSAIGYILDVSWETSPAEKNIISIALFIFFFPQMISGPITRYRDTGVNLSMTRSFNLSDIDYGIRRMLWGYFKKLIISERFALLVNIIYGGYSSYGALDIVFATICYAIQLYTDFSGCMDIIMGAAALFGIRLPENFNAPFFSKNIREFWQHWHITLGEWFRDYLMYPVQVSKPMVSLGKKCRKRFGKNAQKKIPLYLSMALLWCLIGFWHGGTGHQFIGAGLIPLCILISSDLLSPFFSKLNGLLRINTGSIPHHIFQYIRTLLLFCLSLVFIRSSSVSEAFKILGVQINNILKINLFSAFSDAGFNLQNVILSLAGLVLIVFSDHLKAFKESTIYEFVNSKKPLIKICIIYAEILLIMFAGLIGQSEFIYFKF